MIRMWNLSSTKKGKWRYSLSFSSLLLLEQYGGVPYSFLSIVNDTELMQ